MKYLTILLTITIMFFAGGCSSTLPNEKAITIESPPVELKVDQELAQVLNDRLDGDKCDPSCSDIRERLQARHHRLKAFKNAQILGENNHGLLEMRITNGKINASVSKLMDAENQDRKQLFEVIARKQNCTADYVAQRWATQIAEIACAGTWIQATDGNWQLKH